MIRKILIPCKVRKSKKLKYRLMKRKILRNARGINNVPIAHGALVYVRMINASQKETCRNS